MTRLSGSLIYKILTVFFLLCLAKASGGTCLSYGHSCWGGHGKRNGFSQSWMEENRQKGTNSRFISKVLNPTVEKSRVSENFRDYPIRNDDDYNDFDESQKINYEIYPISDWTNVYPRNDIKYSDFDLKSFDRKIEDKNFDEDVVFSAPHIKQRRPISKYKIVQIMERASDKAKSEHI